MFSSLYVVGQSRWQRVRTEPPLFKTSWITCMRCFQTQDVAYRCWEQIQAVCCHNNKQWFEMQILLLWRKPVRNIEYFVLDGSLLECKCDIRNWLYAQQRRECMIQASKLRIIQVFRKPVHSDYKVLTHKIIFRSWESCEGSFRLCWRGSGLEWISVLAPGSNRPVHHFLAGWHLSMLLALLVRLLHRNRTNKIYVYTQRKRLL